MRLCRFLRAKKRDGRQRATVGRGQDKRKTVGRPIRCGKKRRGINPVSSPAV